MARMKDFPHVVRKIGFITFCKRVWQQVGEDNVFTWASALAYSWLFAIFPFVVFLLSLVPLIPNQTKGQVRDQVDNVIDRALPSSDAGASIKLQVDQLLGPDAKSGGFLSFGLLLTAWAASGGMAMTMSALDQAYDIQTGRSFIRHRLVALALTAVIATMVILVLILLPVGTAFLAFFSHRFEATRFLFLWILLFNIIRFVVALVLMIGITALIYHFGPNLKHKFQAVSPGALFAVAGWLITGFAFRMYISSFGGGASYQKTYGAVAGLVILLLFFYIDSLMLLIGAEINSELDMVVIGVPSGPSKEEKAVAPIDTAQNRAMAEEIRGHKEAALNKLEQTGM